MFSFLCSLWLDFFSSFPYFHDHQNLLLECDTKSYFKMLFSLCSSFQSVIIPPKTGLLLSRCLFSSCSLLPLLSRVTSSILHWRGQDSWEQQTLTVLKGLYLWPVVWMLFIIYTELLTPSLNISHFNTVPYYANSPWLLFKTYFQLKVGILPC